MAVVLLALLLAAPSSAALTRPEMEANLDVLCDGVERLYPALERKNIPWRASCEEARRDLPGIGDEAAFHHRLFRLIASLDDSHTYFIDYPHRYLAFGPGAAALCEGDQAFVAAVSPGSPAEAAGLPEGVELLEIAGRTPAERLKEIVPYLSGASTEDLARIEACSRLLQSNEDRAVKVRFRVQGGEKKVKLRRVRSAPPALRPPPLPGTPQREGSLEWLMSDGVGIIRFIDFNDKSDASFERFAKALGALADARALVFDLRGNPGGYSTVPRKITAALVKRRTVIARGSVLEADGRRRTIEESVRPVATPRIDMPVVAIIDGTTRSAAELFASFLSRVGVPLVGTRTGGMLGGSTASLDLPCGLRLRVERGGLVDRDGSPIEGRGVLPDEEVAQPVGEHFSGEDRVLQRAVQIVTKQL